MIMTIEDLRNILNGFVESGMGDVDFKLFLSNKNYETCGVESVNITRNPEGFLVPAFTGTISNA